jgi:hypothetical protein
MRRRTRLGLATFAGTLLVIGAYTAFWLIAAGWIGTAFIGWVQSARAEKVDLSWRELRVIGYPAKFRVDLHSATLRDSARIPASEFRVPRLSATARPWGFADWRLAIPEGFRGDLAARDGRTSAELVARTADGLLSIASEGGWKLWLTMHDTTVDAGAKVATDVLRATITIPRGADHGGSAPATALQMSANHITLPIRIGPMSDTIEELDFDATVKGSVPGGHLANALAAWRDAGGRIELNNLHLEWGGLGANATGTLALDQDLQPVGGFYGAVRGYDQILTALVESGQMRAADAGLARIALGLLAKEAPDGQPEIRTAFKLQNGQMFVGPARLGKVPRLTWE